MYKRISVNECPSFEAYVDLVNSDTSEQAALLNELTINVSWFYREPLDWEVLKAKILPNLLGSISANPDRMLRIWSAGCAHGEEPYTMAMLILELSELIKNPCQAQILATDIDAEIIDKAIEGFYTEDAVKLVPHGMLKKYFRKRGDRFQIIPEVKKMVSFAEYDLLSSKHSVPPVAIIGSFDIVLCQNVMIYYGQTAQEQIFNKVSNPISPGGYLILGSSEKLRSIHQTEFKTVFPASNIYQKI